MSKTTAIGLKLFLDRTRTWMSESGVGNPCLVWRLSPPRFSPVIQAATGPTSNFDGLRLTTWLFGDLGSLRFHPHF